MSMISLDLAERFLKYAIQECDDLISLTLKTLKTNHSYSDTSQIIAISELLFQDVSANQVVKKIEVAAKYQRTEDKVDEKASLYERPTSLLRGNIITQKRKKARSKIAITQAIDMLKQTRDNFISNGKFGQTMKRRWMKSYSYAQRIVYLFTLRETFINLSEPDHLKYLVLLLNDYEYHCHILSTNIELVDYASFRRLDALSAVFRVWPGIVLLFAQITPDPTDKIMRACDSSFLWQPRQIPSGSFGFSIVTKTCTNPKYTYLVNDSSIRMKKLLAGQLDELDEQYRAEVRANILMFLNLSIQARWGSLWTQILSAVYYRDVITSEQAWVNLPDQFKKGRVSNQYRNGLDMLSLQTIMYLIRRYQTLPFHTSETGKIQVQDNLKIDVPFSLPILLASLLEMMSQEAGCNILGPELEQAIVNRIVAAYESFGTKMLENKGLYEPTVKFLHDSVNTHMRYNYHDEMCHSFSVRQSEKVPEIWLSSEEKVDLLTKLKKTDRVWQNVIQEVSSILKSLKDPYQSTEMIRYMRILATIYGNPGTYYKNSTIISEQTATKPAINSPVQTALALYHIRHGGSLMPVAWDFNGASRIVRQISNKFDSLLDTMKDKIIDADFMDIFIELLTNNSQGLKVSIEHLGITEDDVKNAKVSTNNPDALRILITDRLRGSRFIGFLASPEMTSNWQLYLELLRRDGVCTIRYQNNRRSRIVEIVPNHEQMGYVPMLYIFENLKRRLPSAAVGKQRGGVQDAHLQLYSTGSDKMVSNQADIPGMDTATSPELYQLLTITLINWFEKQPDLRSSIYFSANDEVVELYDANNMPICQRKMHGISKLLAHVLNMQNCGKKYVLKDQYFKTTLDVTTQFFPSGRFDTTAQHTLILVIIFELLRNEFDNANPSAISRLMTRVFGDDIFQSFYISEDLDESVVLNRYFQLLKIYLEAVGLSIEPAVSKFYADFLQQSAVCGVYAPKPARASRWNDERGETRSVDPVEAFKIMKSTIEAASQRDYAPDNAYSFINTMWLVNRTILLRGADPTRFLNSAWQSNTFIYRGMVMLVLPWSTIYMPPINSFSPPIKLSSMILGPKFKTTIEGDYGYVWLVNNFFNPEDWKELTTCYYNYDEAKKSIRLTVNGTYFITRPSRIFFNKPEIREFQVELALGVINLTRKSLIDYRRERDLSDIIYRLSNVANSFKNPVAIHQSEVAASLIYERYGIKVPSEIVFAYESRTRVRQAISAIPETGRDRALLDSVHPIKLLDVGTKVATKIQEQIDKFSIRWRYTQEDTNFLHTFVGDWKLPIMPGYHLNSQFSRALSYAGNPFTSQMSSAIGGYSRKQYETRFNFEAAVAVSAKLDKFGPEAQELLSMAMNLNPERRKQFDDLKIKKEMFTSWLEYSSAFSPIKYFGISSSLDNFYGVTITDGKMTQGVTMFLRTLMRDVYFSLLDLTNNKGLVFEFSLWSRLFYFTSRIKRLQFDPISIRVALSEI
ncbi:RNA-dependent RNA polymerase [Acrididae reovirus]|nr:RNA-dependent RNA polymerase [Acrididae reovirus]